MYLFCTPSYFRIFIYYEKSTTGTPDLLYVGVEIDADTTSNSGDYCELFFDQDHNGTAFPEEPSNTNIPVQPPTAPAKEWDGDKRFRRDGQDTTNTFYEMSGGNWAATTNLPKGWRGRANVNGATNHYWYEFKIPLKGIYDNVGNTLQRGIQLNGSGDIAGFMVHAYDAGATRHYFWPDDYQTTASLSPDNTTKPGNWGDLVIDHSKLLINEVASYGDGDGTPAYEWIELYNAGENISLHGMSLTSTTEVVHLGNITLKTGGYAVFHSRTGTTESNSNGNNSAPGSQKGVDGTWDIYGNGTSDYWADAGDYVMLKYEGNNCPMDFMDYGTSITVPLSCNRLNLDLNQDMEWSDTGNELSAPSASLAPLLRIPNAYDTDDYSDWQHASDSRHNYNQGMKNIIPEFQVVAIPMVGIAIMVSLSGIFRKRQGRKGVRP